MRNSSSPPPGSHAVAETAAPVTLPPPNPAATQGELSPPSPALPPLPPATRHATIRFVFFVGVLSLVFASAWGRMLRDALADRLHSYAIAIPFICAWVVWQDRLRATRVPADRTGRAPAVALGIAALAAGVFAVAGVRNGWIDPGSVSWLSAQMLAWVLGIWAAAFWFFGVPLMRAFAFAAGFLVFTIPIPAPLVDLIEIGLQHGSAWMVEIVFKASGVTYHRTEREFWLPFLRFEVAQECSGIRSTIVLFITSVLGSYLLLRAWWRRTLLALAVIPLGLARNTLRICVITLLTAHVDPTIIDSPLHHRGGPLFFAISLVPLFAMLWWFRRQENTPKTPTPDGHRH
jgi:exosortase